MMRQDNNFKKTILILCSCFILSGCGKGTYHRSYIGAYFLTPSIKLSITQKENAIKCEFGFNPEKKVVYCSLFENTEEYDKICEINQDMNFKEYKYVWDYPRSIYPDISSILITSDLDLDSAHPAGMPLNDLFYIIFCSYHEFIDRGYQGHSHYSEGTRHYLKVSEVQPDLLSIINAKRGIFFYFDKKGEKELINTTHNLTFSLTYVDGTTMSNSIEYTFQ
jgi:hypothetical protein